MGEAECPYCHEQVEICHDDGYGMDENILYNQQCSNCEMTFTFRTCISVDYYPEQAPCLNGEEHSYRAVLTYPKEMTQMMCRSCGDRRNPTAEEMQQIMTLT